MDDAKEHLPALSQRIERIRLPDVSNPRAVWVDLDELTVPGPREPAFFEELAGRIVEVGRNAGLNASDADGIVRVLLPYAMSAPSIGLSSVRPTAEPARWRLVAGLVRAPASTSRTAWRRVLPC